MLRNGSPASAANSTQLAGRLLGTSAHLDASLVPGFRCRMQEKEVVHMRVLFLIGMGTWVFYAITSGFGTPALASFRVSSLVAVFLIFISWRLKAGLRDRIFPAAHFTKFRRLERCVTFVGVAHFVVTASFSLQRVAQLVELLHDIDQDEVQDSIGEAYQVLLTSLILFSLSHFHPFPTLDLLVLCIFIPCQWVLQCFFLGSGLEIKDWSKVCFMHLVGCSVAYISGRRTYCHCKTLYAHMHMERLQMRRIYLQASIPIFIVKKDSVTGELQVAMWNAAMEELTHTAVSTGDPLESVACLRSKSTRSLLVAIQQALEDQTRTQQMTVQVVSTKSVWLQVDVSPMKAHNTTEAIIMGSDVTEFVSRHQSLLHLGSAASDCASWKNHGADQASDSPSCMVYLNPQSFNILDSSPQFNQLMRLRVLGRSLLSFVRFEDRQVLRRAAKSACGDGPAGAQQAVVDLYTDVVEESPPQRLSTMQVNMKFTLNVEEGLLEVEVVPLTMADDPENHSVEGEISLAGVRRDMVSLSSSQCFSMGLSCPRLSQSSQACGENVGAKPSAKEPVQTMSTVDTAAGETTVDTAAGEETTWVSQLPEVSSIAGSGAVPSSPWESSVKVDNANMEDAVMQLLELARHLGITPEDMVSFLHKALSRSGEEDEGVCSCGFEHARACDVDDAADDEEVECSSSSSGELTSRTSAISIASSIGPPPPPPMTSIVMQL